MSETLRYGIIGTGMMGVEHINNLLVLDGVEVVAICDPDTGSLDTAGTLVPSAACFDDHHSLLDAGGLDALVVATPNMTHADLLLDVVDTGLPVLVEKPLCATVADCHRVIEAAGPDAMVWVGLEYRYMPAIAGLVESVAAGTVGPIRMVAIREHRFPFLEKVGDWNRFNSNTGGTLVEKCCHFFDLMSLITGAVPVRVMASGAQDVNHLDEKYDGQVPDIIDNAYVIVDFDTGARGMLDLCMFAEATRNQEEISVVGDLGKVEALVPESVLRTGIRGQDQIGDVHEVHVQNPDIGYQGHHHGSSYIEHTRFRDAVLAGTGPESGLNEGLWSVAVGEAAQLSIQESRFVDVDEVMMSGRAETRNV
ncbi:MAG: Gfo/Idh/MocA family oxidoreductase [Acidimicrobiia bacterium]|nr:Gfo/Idh/MocA family oxidoreductase [Actinomycetota bacterium]MBL6925556.1 Gfo/Idh/MocA family oxidoreductase [Acidimicrobiia bacterium]